MYETPQQLLQISSASWASLIHHLSLSFHTIAVFVAWASTWVYSLSDSLSSINDVIIKVVDGNTTVHCNHNFKRLQETHLMMIKLHDSHTSSFTVIAWMRNHLSVQLFTLPGCDLEQQHHLTGRWAWCRWQVELFRGRKKGRLEREFKGVKWGREQLKSGTKRQSY